MEITPVIYVDEVTDVTEQGQKLFGVPTKGSEELMIEARKPLRHVFPNLVESSSPSAALYIDVNALDPFQPLLNFVQVVVPLHKTSYETEEIVVCEWAATWHASQPAEEYFPFYRMCPDDVS